MDQAICIITGTVVFAAFKAYGETFAISLGLAGMAVIINVLFLIYQELKERKR